MKWVPMHRCALSRAVLAAILLALLACGGCELFVGPDKRVARAEQRISTHDYRGAMIELKNALQDQPDHMRARLLLAEVSLRAGDPAAADKELRRAVELGASAQQSSDLAARIRLELGQLRELLAQIDSGELALHEPARSGYRGRALLGLKDVDGAAEAFTTALRADANDVVASTGLAEVRSLQGRSQEALEMLDRVLATQPQRSDAHLVRGTILAGQGRLKEAEAALMAAQQPPSELSPRQRAILFSTLVEVHLAHGEIDKARTSLQSLSQIAADSPLTVMMASRIDLATQNYSAAASGLQRLVAALPDLVPARFLLGAALLAQGNLNQAEAHLARVVEQTPENLEARKLLAQVRLRLERPDAAMQALMAAQTSADTDADVNALTGLAQLQLGDTDAAIELMQRGAASDPGNRGLQLDLATTYLRAGENRKAIDVLRSLPHAADDPRREMRLLAAVTATDGLAAGKAEAQRLASAHAGSISVLNVVALFYARHGEFEPARTYLSKALSIDGENATTDFNWARVEFAAGNLAAARTRLQGIVAAHPDNGPAKLALAELAMREENSQEAARLLEEVRSKYPQALEPRLSLARVYLLGKQTQQADAVLREVAALAAERADIHNAMGLLYLEAGRYDEAISRFKSAVDGDGTNAGYWLNLARAQLAVDRRVLARESLERGRAARPDSLAVIGALVMLDLREGKRDEAQQRIAQLRKQRPDDPAVNVLEGDYYMAQRDYPRAAGAYERALTRRPAAASAYKAYRAKQLGKLGNPAAPIEKWLASHPEDLRGQALLAEEYQRSGQHERAIEKYELIVEHGPANPIVLNNLAWLYHRNGDRRAQATALQAYRLLPRSPSIADTYGWILVENGQLAEGAEILKQAQADGENPNIDFHYSAALARLGQIQEARQRLTRLVERSEAFDSQPAARRLLQELAAAQ